MRKLLLTLCLVGLCMGTIGCRTETTTVFSGTYWKRLITSLGDDLHEFRVDFDRIVFDLDDRPIADY